MPNLVYELLQGGGEVVFALLPDDPNPAPYDDVLGQVLASQPCFSLPEIRKCL